MTGIAEGKTREGSVRIIQAVSILNEEQRRVATLLERLGPDGVVVVIVEIRSGHGYLEQGAARKLEVQVEAVPTGIEIEAESEFRTVALAEDAAVLPGNLAVTVEVGVFDIAHIGTGAVPGAVVNFLLAPVQALGLPAPEGIVSGSAYLLPLGDVGLVVVLEPTGLGVCERPHNLIEKRLASQVEAVAMTQLDVNTSGINGVAVDIGREITAHGIGMTASVVGKDVVSIIVEGVNLTAQFSAPEGEVRTDIVRQGLFPGQFSVRSTRGAVSGNSRLSRINDFLVKRVFAQEHVRRYAVVAQQTHGRPKFQVVQHTGSPLHKGFLGEIPADGT